MSRVEFALYVFADLSRTPWRTSEYGGFGSYMWSGWNEKLVMQDYGCNILGVGSASFRENISLLTT